MKTSLCNVLLHALLYYVALNFHRELLLSVEEEMGGGGQGGGGGEQGKKQEKDSVVQLLEAEVSMHNIHTVYLGTTCYFLSSHGNISLCL